MSGGEELKKIDLGQSLTILANLGVIAGILLLAYELNQNRQMMQAQTRHELASSIANQLLTISVNGEYVEFIHRVESGEPATGVEQRRYYGYAFARLRYWEDAHYQYRVGLFDEGEFVAQRESWREVIRQPGMRDFWSRFRSNFSPEFAEEIDELLIE